ncbi:Myb-like DNA-binding domain [Pyrenophora tritici-repentis]|nr:Myb-like DNA-binding domain [Pyrenophora tritici-repentis]PZC99917.1 REB1, Myb superfamily protein, transcription factor and mRNA splicing factor [Pyrenophora tritici-repentis]
MGTTSSQAVPASSHDSDASVAQNSLRRDQDQVQFGRKTKLKRVKKPQTPVAKARNIYDIPGDEPHPPSGAAVEAGEAYSELRSNVDAKAEMTTATNATNGFIQLQVADQVAVPQETSSPKEVEAVRKPGQSSNETPEPDPDEDTIFQTTESSNDEIRHRHPANKHQTARNKQRKKLKARSNNVSAIEPDTRSITPQRRRSDKFDTTPAERALSTCRHLNQPPVLRNSGEFTKDEIELIRRAIADYQQRKGLEVSELVDIIHWSKHDPGLNHADRSWRKSNWSVQDEEDARESDEFWADIRNVNLTRPFDIQRNHIRAVYHCYKTGAWSEEEDEQLRMLYDAHPKQWKVISVTMGTRSMQDCHNRWRDYVKCGETRNKSHWSQEEEHVLIRAVNTVAQKDEDVRAATGKPARDGYTNKDINWPQVSHEMGNIRSRIQASVKWNRMMKRDNPPEIQVEYKPRQSQPQSVVTATRRKRGRPRKSHVTETMVEKSDGEEQGVRVAKKPRKCKSHKTPNAEPGA